MSGVGEPSFRAEEPQAMTLFSKMVDALGSSHETWSQFVAITQIREMG